ncbi:DUF2029 domain-containing protein [bacterium]|nr:MAG: DUF2029 domain-containing protein [bacterium]
MGRLALDARARRNLGAAALAWFGVLAGAITAWFVFQPIRHDALDSDLTLVLVGIRIGLDHGWTHIYSLDLQRQAFEQLRPGALFGSGERFLSPPPLVWLALPLSLLGGAAAFYVWTAASLAALAAAWWLAAPGAGPRRWLWLIGALAWYPLQYGLSLGQPVLLVLLVAIASWKLAEAGRPLLAGLVLGLATIKPQLTLVLPAVLLAAGHWRLAAAWALTAGVLAAASLIAVGGQGAADYRSLLGDAQLVANNRYFTLAYFVGPGALSYAAQAAVILAGLAGAYMNRGAGLARLFALGLVASASSATYWHLQDYTMLVAAAWLFWRGDPPRWQRWWLLVVVVGGELAWPLRPLPVLIGLAVWLACLAVPRRPQARTRALAPA